MQQLLKYFGLSGVVTLLCMFGGYYFGGITGLTTVIILGVLEVSLSLDNAVVNAVQIKKMDAFWRKMFLTVGMLIAVFGMRVLFPLLIVSFTTEMTIAQAGALALQHPKDYASALIGAHAMIAGFGGAFLMMVFLKFFIDEEKDAHWLSWIERPLAELGKIEAIQIAVTLVALYATSTQLVPEEGHKFFMAGIAGILTYIIVDSLEVVIAFFTNEETSSTGSAATQVAKAGLATFLYLEVLDASFSFDGVIGAFAITTSVPIIMFGLTIGAMFVRSLTILAVDKDTLAEYKFLEHGAFYAIGSLAAIMFVGTFCHIPEIVSGLIGAAFLATSFGYSIYHKRTQPELYAEDSTEA